MAEVMVVCNGNKDMAIGVKGGKVVMLNKDAGDKWVADYQWDGTVTEYWAKDVKNKTVIKVFVLVHVATGKALRIPALGAMRNDAMLAAVHPDLLDDPTLFALIPQAAFRAVQSISSGHLTCDPSSKRVFLGAVEPRSCPWMLLLNKSLYLLTGKLRNSILLQ